mgnify:CR=1 FL=1
MTPGCEPVDALAGALRVLRDEVLDEHRDVARAAARSGGM